MVNRRGVRICSYAGCYVRTRGRRCERHSLGKTRPGPRRKGLGTAKWRRRRERAFRAEPWCCSHGAPCGAEQWDHIWPRDWGGPDEDWNLWGLCRREHSRKTCLEGKITVASGQRLVTSENLEAWVERLRVAGFVLGDERARDFLAGMGCVE